MAQICVGTPLTQGRGESPPRFVIIAPYRFPARTPAQSLSTRVHIVHIMLYHTHIHTHSCSTCEATVAKNAALIKAMSPETKVFSYHNMELALESLESQNSVMYDPSKAYYFLRCGLNRRPVHTYLFGRCFRLHRSSLRSVRCFVLLKRWLLSRSDAVRPFGPFSLAILFCFACDR